MKNAFAVRLVLVFAGCEAEPVDTVAAADAESDESNGFIPGDDESTSEETSEGTAQPDMAPSCGHECDIWKVADCPSGQKCTAVVCDPYSTVWDRNVCVDIQGAQPVGAPCQYIGEFADGIDDCEVGAMCWNWDPDTEMGTCLARCQNAAAPICPDGSYCQASGDGPWPFCQPYCDPLLQDCQWTGDTCLPSWQNDGFVCLSDGSGGVAPRGTPCTAVSTCNSGLICAAPATVDAPGCDLESCCTSMCDASAPNECAGDTEECVSLGFPSFDVGACQIPEAP